MTDSLPLAFKVTFSNPPDIDGYEDIGTASDLFRCYRPQFTAARQYPGHWYPVATYDQNNTNAVEQADKLVSVLEDLDDLTSVKSNGTVFVRGYVEYHSPPPPDAYINPTSAFDVPGDGA